MRHVETAVTASFFVTCHFVSPWLFRLREGSRRTVSSFSGGLAAAYIVLHLLPEIDEGGKLLGPRIYVVLLVGLAAYYGLEVFIHRRQATSEAPRSAAVLHFLGAAAYTALLQFTLAQQLPSTVALTVVFAATMGLHLISFDFGLQEEHGERYVRSGRFILIGAAIAGYALSFAREPHEEYIDLLTALLAGFMMFNVFRKEIPEFRDARYKAFLAGMGLLFVAHVLLSVGSPESR